MELGMIGLGRMGGNMAQRLMRGGHKVVGFDPNAEARKALEGDGGGSADSLQALVAGLIKNQRTEYDKVSAIYRYFSRDNGFTYSLQTADPQAGKSAIVAFLKEGKAGYCQQYAAAMAWMVPRDQPGDSNCVSAIAAPPTLMTSSTMPSRSTCCTFPGMRDSCRQA